MAFKYPSTFNAQYFKFKVENESTRYTIPISVTEGSDSFTVNSSWTKQNVQGSTEGMVAFNYVDNPTLNISIKFNEDICRELNSSQSFEKIVSKLVALQYPGEKSGHIVAPYVWISYDNFAYRGYFSNLRVTLTGPYRNGHKTICEVTGTFNIVKKHSPTHSGVANDYRKYYQ